MLRSKLPLGTEIRQRAAIEGEGKATLTLAGETALCQQKSPQQPR
jgi:hypothetical protein